MIITDLKNQIKTKLNALVTAGTIGEVQMDDFKQSIFSRNFAKFPAVILTSPSVSGVALTNGQNERTHVFNMIVILKGENITSATDVENLMENMMNAFDNDQTLGGKADGGVEPSASAPEPVTDGTRSYVVFGITLKASATKDLSFS